MRGRGFEGGGRGRGEGGGMRGGMRGSLCISVPKVIRNLC